MLTNFIQSSRSEPCFQKGVHNTRFPKFTGKYSCRSLFFNKVKGSELATLLQKRKCFPVLKNTFFTENLPGAVTWICSVKKGFLKSFETFTGKHQAWRSVTLLKRDSSTGVVNFFRFACWYLVCLLKWI